MAKRNSYISPVLRRMECGDTAEFPVTVILCLRPIAYRIGLSTQRRYSVHRDGNKVIVTRVK